MASSVTIKAGYEKQECAVCTGTGRIKKTPGRPQFYNWKSDRRRRPPCPDCGGIGFHVTKRKP